MKIIKCAMSSEFFHAWQGDWLTWCGGGMLYDGDLFVTRD